MAYVVPDPPNPAVVADSGVIDFTEGLSGDNSTQGQPKDDSLACFRNYISVFEWKNPSANLMSEIPQLSASKLGTLNLASDIFSDASISLGWRIEGMVKVSKDGQSSSALQFLKSQADSSDSLDCYFMRAVDKATRDAGLANVLFKNVGADLDANIFLGFLRYSEQFIACRVTSGHGDIELKNEGESSMILSSSQAFILKRGCFSNSKTTN